MEDETGREPIWYGHTEGDLRLLRLSQKILLRLPIDKFELRIYDFGTIFTIDFSMGGLLKAAESKCEGTALAQCNLIFYVEEDVPSNGPSSLHAARFLL